MEVEAFLAGVRPTREPDWEQQQPELELELSSEQRAFLHPAAVS